MKTYAKKRTPVQAFQYNKKTDVPEDMANAFEAFGFADTVQKGDWVLIKEDGSFSVIPNERFQEQFEEVT